jgi:excisionase family DNA binding protein
MEINLITAIDVAKVLKISKALAYRLISQGQIPSVRFGKTVRVKPEDLEKFIQNNLSGQGFPSPNPDLMK